MTETVNETLLNNQSTENTEQDNQLDTSVPEEDFAKDETVIPTQEAESEYSWVLPESVTSPAVAAPSTEDDLAL